MIRQAISCDICGAEKKQTNHWFVASEQGGEMRVRSWNSRNRLRAGSKHLCGQTCLHKLLDEFLARSVEDRPITEPAAATMETPQRPSANTRFEEEESSARLITPVEVERTQPMPMIAIPLRTADTAHPITLPRIDESAAEAAWRRRAEAWERERARELRVVERRPN